MIEQYLDELAEALNVEPAYARRILIETEDHLREAAEAETAQGIDRGQAERWATQQFGSVREVARRFGPQLPVRTWLFRSYVYLALLGAVVLIAGGIAGELSAGFGLAFGKSYIAGDTNGVTYTASRCADFFEYHPTAQNCEQAATLHHFDEIWRNADVALVLGALVLAVHVWARKRFMRTESVRSLPRRMFWLSAMCGFGVAAPALAFIGGVGGLTNGYTGQVPMLIGAIVCAMAFIVFVRPGLQQARTIVRQYAA